MHVYAILKRLCAWRMHYAEKNNVCLKCIFVPRRNEFRKGDIEIPVSVRPCVRPSQLRARNSSETAQRISFKFCRIVSHHMYLIILYCHFDSTNFTPVMGLCWFFRTCYTVGTICARNSSETAQRISFKFCRIVSHHMYLIILYERLLQFNFFCGGGGHMATRSILVYIHKRI